MVAKSFIISNFLLFDCIKDKPVPLSNKIALFFPSNSKFEIVPVSRLSQRNLLGRLSFTRLNRPARLLHPPAARPNNPANPIHPPRRNPAIRNPAQEQRINHDSIITSNELPMLEGHLLFLTNTGEITSFNELAKSNPPFAIQYLAPSGPEYDVGAILFENPFDIQHYSNWSLQCTWVVIFLL